MGKIIITVVGILVSIRGIRIYSRTGLKGELLIGVAGFIFVLAYQANDVLLGIIGYILINIGTFTLFKSDKVKWKAIFAPLSYYSKIVGNVPHILNESESRTTYKVTGVISGLLCLLMAFEFSRRLKTIGFLELLENDIVGLVVIGILILAGLLLISYYYFQKGE